LPGVQEFFRRLSAQEGTPHVHQDENPIVGINGRNRFLNIDRIGAKQRTIVAYSPGTGQWQVWADHAAQQVSDCFGEGSTVGH
jgi:hypothetical protein